MQEVYSGAPLARTEDLRNTGGCYNWRGRTWRRISNRLLVRGWRPLALFTASPSHFFAASQPASADCIPKDLLPHYQRLLASQPARRLNPRAILEAGVLRNRLAEATSFLESLAIKDAMEKVRDLHSSAQFEKRLVGLFSQRCFGCFCASSPRALGYGWQVLGTEPFEVQHLPCTLHRCCRTLSSKSCRACCPPSPPWWPSASCCPCWPRPSSLAGRRR